MCARTDQYIRADKRCKKMQKGRGEQSDWSWWRKICMFGNYNQSQQIGSNTMLISLSDELFLNKYSISVRLLLVQKTAYDLGIKHRGNIIHYINRPANKTAHQMSIHVPAQSSYYTVTVITYLQNVWISFDLCF